MGSLCNASAKSQTMAHYRAPSTSVALCCGTFLLLVIVLFGVAQANRRQQYEVSQEFAHKMYNRLSHQSEHEQNNCVFSPLGLEVVMRMLDVGLSSKSARDLEQQLFDADMGDNLQMMKAVQSGLSKAMIVKSKGYLDFGIRMSSNFKRKLKSVFHTSFDRVQFSSPQLALDEINGWVQKVTDGMIKKIAGKEGLPMADPHTALVLLSAVVFHGKWKNEFNKSKTRPMDFSLDSQKKVQVPMMYSKQSTKFVRKSKVLNRATILNLPYNEGSLSMVIVLPAKDTGLNDLEGLLVSSESRFKEAMKELFDEDAFEVEIYLPKFKIESDFAALKSMKEMGLPDLEVSKVVAGSTLQVTSINQRACIEVDEEGTKAAAVTSVSMSFRSLMIAPTLNVDRPFMYYIYNQKNKLIYFMGKSAMKLD